MAINFRRRPDEAKVETFIANAGRPAEDKPSSAATVVNVRINTALLGRIDADARRLGINRTAWLHVAANKMLEG